MRLGCFWFGSFFGGLVVWLGPFRVKDARLVDALVRVRAKEVALRLQKVGR
jgi:hypothetical protein